MGIDKKLLTPTPHPEYDNWTREQIREDLARIEDDLSFARERGVDPVFVAWLETEMGFAFGELERRNGQSNFTSDYRNPLSEVKFEREINAGTLQAETIAQGIPAGTFKPFLGRDGYVVKGCSIWSQHFPKPARPN